MLKCGSEMEPRMSARIVASVASGRCEDSTRFQNVKKIRKDRGRGAPRHSGAALGGPPAPGRSPDIRLHSPCIRLRRVARGARARGGVGAGVIVTPGEGVRLAFADFHFAYVRLVFARRSSCFCFLETMSLKSLETPANPLIPGELRPAGRLWFRGVSRDLETPRLSITCFQ